MTRARSDMTKHTHRHHHHHDVETDSKEDPKLRHQSLPNLQPTKPHQPLRHTLSHERRARGAVRAAIPQIIPEDQEQDVVDDKDNELKCSNVNLSIISELRNSNRSSSRSSRSRRSNSSEKETHAFDNAAYEGPQSGSATVSRNDSNRSSRNPSVQSLPVIREQYCCCSRRTPCERILVALVAILATIIVILVAVISYVCTNGKGKGDQSRETFFWKL